MGSSGKVARWDFRGWVNAPEPLEWVVRLTPLCHSGGQPAGPARSQQLGPESDFLFPDLPRGIYRVEAVGPDGPQFLHAYQGYSCYCDFAGREPFDEVVHDDGKSWKIRLGFKLVVEAYDGATGEPARGARLGHTREEAPGRVALWLTLGSDPRTYWDLTAPGYARVELPGLPFRHPVGLQRVPLEPEFPLTVQLVGSAGGSAWIKVHQTAEECPVDPRRCRVLEHKWYQFVKRGRGGAVVVRGLPATRGTRTVYMESFDGYSEALVIPGDQGEVTLEVPKPGTGFAISGD